MAAGEGERPHLLRVLGCKEGIALHMGAIIGSGIFVVPATIAGHLPYLGPILLVWITAGLLTLFGALTMAELSAVLPEAGGPYVYLSHSFGRIWGYLFSWNDFFINKAGSAAAIAVSFSLYLGHFVPALRPDNLLFRIQGEWLGVPIDLHIGWDQIVAMLVIAVVTVINVRGVRLAGLAMDLFTTAKVLALAALVLAVFFSGKGSAGNFAPWWPDAWSRPTTAAFGVAMISALWAYDGWIDVTLAAGEFKRPERDVPLSLIIGSLAVIVIYMVANIAFVYAIPLAQMAGSTRIAADVAQQVLGPTGASFVAVAIMISTFGSTNGMLLAGPRSIYAAAVDGAAAAAFGRVHPQYRTPYVAVLTLGIWSAVLTLSGSYEQIASYVVFGAWFFYALTALSVIVLRRKMPEAPRSYRAWGYPWATLLFVGIAAWFLYNTLVEDTRNAIVGICLLMASLPLYFYWTRRSAARPMAPN